jgi:hypothetical protein
VPISSDFLARGKARKAARKTGAERLPLTVSVNTPAKKIGSGGNFLLHRRADSPISQLTRREKKPDKAATG